MAIEATGNGEFNARDARSIASRSENPYISRFPDIEALVEDALFFGPDEDGLCFNCWGVTDNYDSDRPFACMVIDYGEGIILDAA